jgi:hypothetical protein
VRGDDYRVMRHWMNGGALTGFLGDEMEVEVRSALHEIERLRAAVEVRDQALTVCLRELAAERAEVAALRQWKAEATTVLTQWFDVADQIVQELDFNDTIGRPKMDIVADEFVRLRAKIERLRDAGDALAEVADEWPELAEAWMEARRER